MCVRNAARWIEASLSSQHFCEQILVMDDLSTDGTVEICSRFQNVHVFPSPFSDYQEGRNNEFLVTLAAALQPDWVVHCMGDEVLEPDTWNKIQPIITDPSVNVIRFRAINLWGGGTVRTDGQWALRYGHPIWRFPVGKKLTYYPMHCGLPEQIEANMHPHPDEAVSVKLGLWHFGYALPSLRQNRYNWYMRHDFGRREQYKHLLDSNPALQSVGDFVRLNGGYSQPGGIYD